MDQIAERDLLGRCRSGDEGAFAELVDGYKNLVFALVSRTIADKSRVEDVAQDVFIKVHRGLPYFRGDSKLSTWIYRIVQNVCADERRRGGPEMSLDATDEEGRPLVTPGGADRQFADLELRDRLDKALARLPAKTRVLIAAYYFDERQYGELAAALGMPLGTVKIQLHRAKRRLRELLEEEASGGGRTLAPADGDTHALRRHR